MTKMSNRGVTVILSVYNQGQTVAKCLQSLLEQTYTNVEIWVADDGSTDNTREIVSNFPVRLFRFKHRGRTRTLNELLPMVETEPIAIVEGDAIYQSNYLEACIKHFASRQVGGVIARQLAVKCDSLVSRAISAYREVRWNLVDRPKYIESTAWVFRRKALEDVGGFDGDLTVADDAAMGITLIHHGWRIEFEPDTAWYHHEPTSLRALMRQRFRWGVGSYVFLKKYGGEFTNPHVKMRWKTLLGFYGFLFLAVIAFFFFRAGFFLLASLALSYLFVRTIYFMFNARKVTKDTLGALLFPAIDLLGKVAFSIGFFFGCLDTAM